MKRQSVGLVLCALLMSTFGHEFLQRQQQAHSARIARSPKEAHSQEKHLRLPPPTPTPPPQDCVTVCEGSCDNTQNNLTIIFNAKTGLIGVYNETAKILLVIDIKAQIVGIWDYSSHTAILIDIKTHKGLSFSFNDNRTAEQFIQQVTSLKVYWSYKGDKFDENNVSEKVLAQIRLALVVLSGGEFTTSGKEGFTLLLQISLRISVALSSVIQVVGSATVSGVITLRGVLEIVEGLAAGVVLIGEEVIVKRHVKISLTQVIVSGRVRSSVEIAVTILILLSGSGVDTSKITSTQESILLFIAAFGGNSTNGVTGVFQVVADIVGFIDKTVTIQTLIGVLIEFVVSNRNNHSLSKDFYTTINATIKALQDAHGGASLKKVLDVLIKIRDHKLHEGDVDISAIIDVLVGYNGDGKSIPLTIVIRVLVLLKVRIDIGSALINLFGHLLVLLLSGTVNIVAFILAIEIEIGASILGEIIHALLTSGGNLLRFISSIRVVNLIYIHIGISLKASGVNIDISSIFGQNGVIKIVIEILETSGIHVGGIGTLPHGPGPVITKTTTEESESGGISESYTYRYSWGGTFGDKHLQGHGNPSHHERIHASHPGEKQHHA